MQPTRQGTSRPGMAPPYRHPMPRVPKDFTISSIEIEKTAPVTRLVAPGRAAPSWFDAKVTLGELPLELTITVVIGPGGEPLAKRLDITAQASEVITTSGLRRVLVDQLLKAAVAEASFPVEYVHGITDDPGAIAYKTPGPGPLGEEGPIINVDVSGHLPGDTRQQRQDERARQAAKIYAAAVNSGSRAPGDAVATEMGYSRSQAARYIRRARELGILPPSDAKDGAE